jgi:hypothetical protein
LQEENPTAPEAFENRKSAIANAGDADRGAGRGLERARSGY